MAEQSVPSHLAVVSEEPGDARPSELTMEMRAELMALRAANLYPDNYVLREIVVSLSKLVAEIAAKLEATNK